MKTAGQIAYENDLAIAPVYHDGTTRKSWDALPAYARESWERNPTSRTYGVAPERLHIVDFYSASANEGGEGLWRGEADALAHAERILARHPDAEVKMRRR